jgi:hypothetical protein
LDRAWALFCPADLLCTLCLACLAHVLLLHPGSLFVCRLAFSIHPDKDAANMQSLCRLPSPSDYRRVPCPAAPCGAPPSSFLSHADRRSSCTDCGFWVLPRVPAFALPVSWTPCPPCRFDGVCPAAFPIAIPSGCRLEPLPLSRPCLAAATISYADCRPLGTDCGHGLALSLFVFLFLSSGVPA